MKHWHLHNIHEADLLQLLYKVGISHAALLLMNIQINDGLQHLFGHGVLDLRKDK